MRYDDPLRRGGIPFVGCLLIGQLLSVWATALDGVAGRITLSRLFFCALVVGCWLLGVAVIRWGSRRLVHPSRWCSPILLACAFYALLLLLRAGAVEHSWQRLLVDFHRTSTGFLSQLFTTSFLFFAVPSFLAGMLVQLTVVSILHTPERQRAVAMGLLFLTGVLPGLVGIWLLGGLARPWGVLNATRLLVLGFGVLSVAAAILYGERSRRRWIEAGACLVLALAAGFFSYRTTAAATLQSAGVFPRLICRDSGFARGKAEWEKRTQDHTFSFFADKDYGFVLAQDGCPRILKNRFHTVRTVSGYLPLLLNPDARRVAVLGDNAGYVIPFILRGGIQQVDYSACSSEQVRIAVTVDDMVVRGLAVPSADQPLLKRVKDKVRFGESEYYDLVYLEPEPVWMRGTSGSYGVSLFSRCHRIVGEHGLVSLHLDTRAMSTRRFISVARAFLSVFPFCQFWNIGLCDWIVVGAKEPFDISANKMYTLFCKDEVTRDFMRAGVLSLTDILPCLLCNQDGIRAWVSRSESETAWQGAIRLPQLVLDRGEFCLRPNQVEGCRQRTLAWFQQGGLSEDIYEAICDGTRKNVETRALVVATMAELSKGDGKSGMEAAATAGRMNPRDLLLQELANSLDLEGWRRIDLGDFKGAKSCYESLRAIGSKHARANFGLGVCLRAQGDNKAAFEHFGLAVKESPENNGYRMELAQVAGVLGHFEEADKQYRQVLKRDPKNADALFRYAKSLSNPDRAKPDFDAAIHYAEEACGLTRWNNPEYSYGLADIYIAAGKTMEGIGLKRRLKEMGR